jgi:allophanate hydrolase subunit 2
MVPHITSFQIQVKNNLGVTVATRAATLDEASSSIYDSLNVTVGHNLQLDIYTTAQPDIGYLGVKLTIDTGVTSDSKSILLDPFSPVSDTITLTTAAVIAPMTVTMKIEQF